MLLPKNKETMVRNLNSIMSDIRGKTLTQIKNYAGFTQEEKITHLKTALKDPEEAVRKIAERILGELGEPVPQAEAPTESASAPAPTPTAPPPAASVAPPVSLPPVEEPAAPEPAATLPDMSAPDAAIAENQEITIQAPPFEEEFDPALPAIESLKTIPQRLDHAKYLSKEKPAGHISQLLELAYDQIEEISLTALQSLLKIKDPRVPSQVLPLLADPNFSSQRRFLILKIVMETKTDLEISHIEHILMHEKDVIVKSGLVKVFARCAGENGVRTLKKCLFDPDPRVRANTVEVIEEQGIRGCDGEIVKLLNDSENRVKVNTAKYLVKQGHGQAFNTLKTMLGSSEVWLRDSVIFALGEIGDQSSLTLLKAALKDPNQGIRLSVLKALAKINNASSREALQGAEKDSDAVVAQVARGLFEKIKDTPLTPAKTMPTAKPPAAPATAEAPVSPPPAPKPAPAQVAPPPAAPRPVAPPQVAAPPAVPEPEAPQPPQASAEEAMALPEMEPPATPVVPTKPVTPPKPVAPPVPVAKPPAPTPPTVTAPPPRPASPTAPKPPAASPTPTAPPRPAAPTPAAAPPRPSPAVPPKPAVAAPKPPAPPAAPAAPVTLPPGSPTFQKPRSAEIFQKLSSNNPDLIQAAMKDLPFIAGDDQMILVAKAVTIADDAVRLAAAKVLSRKRGPAAVEMMQRLAADPSEMVHTFAQKALTLMK